MMEFEIDVQHVIESLQRQVLDYASRLAKAEAVIAALQAAQVEPEGLAVVGDE